MKANGRLVCGVGINDANYPVRPRKEESNTMCKFYRTWSNMLKRCYSKKENKCHETYKECKVCNEWLIFSNFKAWMEKQDWHGKELDKDILYPGNKVYSPDNCVFVSHVINSFITDRSAARGNYPIGVCWDKREGKFMAQCGDPFTKKSRNIGRFSSPEEAHKAWKSRKHELACQLADMQSDERVAKCLRERYL